MDLSDLNKDYPLGYSFLLLSIIFLGFFYRVLELCILASILSMFLIVFYQIDRFLFKKTRFSIVSISKTCCLRLGVYLHKKIYILARKSKDSAITLIIVVKSYIIKTYLIYKNSLLYARLKCKFILLNLIYFTFYFNRIIYKVSIKVLSESAHKFSFFIKNSLKILKKQISKISSNFSNLAYSINILIYSKKDLIRKSSIALAFICIFVFTFIGIAPNEKSIVTAVVGGSCAYDTDCDLCEYCPDTCDDTIDYDGETNKCTDDAGYGPPCDPGYCGLTDTCEALTGGVEDTDNGCYDYTGCSATGGDYCRCYGDDTCLTNDGGYCTGNSDCYSGYCDSDGVGLADDDYCFTPYNTYFDGEENTYCEYSTGAITTIYSDEREVGDPINLCSEASESYFADIVSSVCELEDDTSTCRSSAYAGDCTASAECNDVVPDSCSGTSGYCNICVFEDPDSTENACDCSETSAGCGGGSCYNTSWYFEAGTGDCCGDDANEYFVISDYHESIEGAISDTEACCDAEYDCVHSNLCYSNNSFMDIDVDSDSDYDYCLEGKWYDCGNNSGCAANYNCVANDCIYEGIIINNIGQIGFETTNQEYTSLRTVILLMGYDNSTADKCRYKNSDGEYTNWEECREQKYWLLSSGQGLKQVFYQINRTDDSIGTFNDTIYLNYTGAGLDTTAPLPATIIDGDYTNVNDSLYVYWVNASDPESELLNIELYYNYDIYVNGVFNRSGTTYLTYFNETGFNLQNEDNITVNVTVVNSAGLTSTTTSDGLVIDVDEPNAPTIDSTHPENIWNSTNIVSFNWSSSDATSGIYGYSYVLSTSGNNPDNVPEGSIGNLANELSKTYANVEDGIYYFKIKARDNAGNWGDISTYVIKVDSTKPRKPNYLSELFNSTDRSIVYDYTSVNDLSGIYLYQINITDVLHGTSNVYLTNKTSFKYNNTNHTNYYFKVRVKNGAELWSVWSDEKEIISDIVKPGFWAKPNGNITSTTPIFVARTDEIAICKYKNSSSEFAEFIYTNSTYHETKVSSLGGTYNITCADKYGNVNSTLIMFEYTSNRITNVPELIAKDSFIGETTNITVNTQEDYGEIRKNEFSVYLNNRKIDDYNLYDHGRGNYTIGLKLPKSAGLYTVNVTVHSVSTAKTFNVENLTLTLNYRGSVTTKNTTRILYSEKQNYTMGLATNSHIFEKTTGTDLMQLKAYAKDRNMIIVTDRIDNTDKKDSLLRRQAFFDLYKPSFGYEVGKDNEIKLILAYQNYIINGSEELGTGEHSFLIKNIRPIVNNKKILLVTTDISETSDLGVYDYEG
jgi:hypothetical protein